jgi:hypothetical protein
MICYVCGGKATIRDPLYPWHQEKNYCKDCLKGNKKRKDASYLSRLKEVSQMTDIERKHSEADDIVIEVLRELGLKEIADEYMGIIEESYYA